MPDGKEVNEAECGEVGFGRAELCPVLWVAVYRLLVGCPRQIVQARAPTVTLGIPHPVGRIID